MDLKQLRYFVAVAEELHFGRAAQRLFISQPALSFDIRKFEEQLGVQLLARTNKSVALTNAGQVLLDEARKLLQQAAEVERITQRSAHGLAGRLRVGFVGSATFELLPRLIAEYRRRYPAVELVLEEATSAEIARKLAAGELDVGLVRLPLLQIAAVDTQVIDPDELYAALPEGSPFADADSVELSDLAEQPFILQSRISVLHSIALTACQKAGFMPIVAQEAAQLSAVLALVRSGLGVALVPSRAAGSVPQGVRLVRLASQVPVLTGVALPRDTPSPLARNFAAIASDSH